MVFATTFHDSGYREWEGSPPINLAKGRPYAHRETIPSFEAVELSAYNHNVEWLRARDRYGEPAGINASNRLVGQPLRCVYSAQAARCANAARQ